MTDGVSDSPKRWTGPRIGGRAATGGKKRAVNVSVDESLLAEARDLKINLSQTLEEVLQGKVRDEKIRRFQEENREAFESYNRFIEEHGLWIDEYREP